MAVIWFSDEDRERMRRERDEFLERDKLFWEFIHDGEPQRRRRPGRAGEPRMGTLDIRPWTARPGDEH